MTAYTTREEAINAEIIAPLGEYADQHNIDAIADKVLTTTGEGTTYRWALNTNVDFWQTVANNANN